MVEYTLNDLELLFPLATKYHFKMKFKWLLIFNFASNVIRVECIRDNYVLIAAKVVHHAGVATRMNCELRKLGKKVGKVEDEMMDYVMIKRKEMNTNFAFLVGMFQLPEKHGPSLCSDKRIFLLYKHGNLQY